MIDLFSKVPLSEQLAELIRKDYIIPGANGDRLPAFAKISKKYGVGLGATQEAFRKLQKEGAILSRSGVGSFIHKTDTAKEKIRVAFPNEAPLSVICEDIIKMFVEDHSDCEVDMIPIETSEYAEFINRSNKDVDVAIIRESDFMGIDSGSLVHLPEKSVSKYDIWEECWELFTRLKRVYATPILFSPSTLVYNPEKFKKAGIKAPSADCSASEFKEITEELTENDGLFCLTFNPNRWLCMLLGEGVPISNINGKPMPNFTHPSFNKALKKVTKAFRNNALLQQEGTLAKCICNGSVDMMLGSYMSTLWRLRLSNKENKKVNLALCPLPKTDGTNTLLMGSGVALLKKAASTTSAAVFRDYTLKPKVQKYIRNFMGGGIPALKSAAGKDKVKFENITVSGYDNFKAEREKVVLGVERRDEIWVEFCSEIELVISGINSPEDVASNMIKMFPEQLANLSV